MSLDNSRYLSFIKFNGYGSGVELGRIKTFFVW